MGYESTRKRENKNIKECIFYLKVRLPLTQILQRVVHIIEYLGNIHRLTWREWREGVSTTLTPALVYGIAESFILGQWWRQSVAYSWWFRLSSELYSNRFDPKKKFNPSNNPTSVHKLAQLASLPFYNLSPPCLLHLRRYQIVPFASVLTEAVLFVMCMRKDELSHHLLWRSSYYL